MPKRLPKRAVFLGFLVAICAFKLTYDLATKAPGQAAASDGREVNRLPIASKRPETADVFGETSMDEAKATNSLDSERILRFADVASMQRFLEAAERNGLRILDSDKVLRAVRVSTLSKEDLARLRSMMEDGTSLEENYTVLLPFPVNTVDGGGANVPANLIKPLIGGAKLSNSDWGKGIKIAILDTGILPHSSLANASVKEIDLIGDGRTGKYDSHGTAVATIVAGKSGISEQIEIGNGVAPDSEILSVRVLDADGIGDTFTLAKGIVAAVDADAQIINLSLGSYGTNSVLEDAIAYAKAKGVVVVAAAGNEGLSTLPYPAFYEDVIAVAAVDGDNQHASFSNTSASVDLAAPGIGVIAGVESDSWIRFDGTSAASPIVAASIAAVASSLGIDVSVAADLVRTQSNDIGYPGRDEQTGAGVLDLERIFSLSESGFDDLGLADIYLSTTESTDDLAVAYVTAQNLGRQTVMGAALKVSTPAGTTTTYLPSLSESETGSIRLEIPTTALLDQEKLLIEASVVRSSRTLDARPENDTKSRQFSLGDNPPEED